MKQTLSLILIVAIAIALYGTDAVSAETFTVVGKYVTPTSNDTSTDSASGGESQSGWKSASVQVMREVLNDDGVNELVELASGNFVDGSLKIMGEIDEPTMVTISVSKVDGEESLKRTVLVEPGGEAVSFALVDRQVAYRSVRMVLVGTSSRVVDEARRFTVKGNFRAMQDELSLGIVTVSGPGLNAKGEIALVTHGSVLLYDGMFRIESEIHEPSVLFVTAMAGENAFNEYYGMVNIVVEPHSVIAIEPRGWGRELVATAKHGRHHRLVDSWQQSASYQTLLNDYGKSYKDFRDAWEASYRARQAAALAAKTEESSSGAAAESGNQPEDTTSSDDESDQEEVEEEEKVLAFSHGRPQADGCEHVAIADADTENGATLPANDNPEYHKLFLELVDKRTEALEQIASNSDDPMDVLLAMELGAFGYDSENIKKSVPTYDKIAAQLDPEFVSRRVTRARDDIASYIETDEIDKRLVPGQIAPSFTLPDLSGSEVAFSDVVADNDMVLIDFWASWCGPCIAVFPDLKELYASYGGNGFEIVAVSLDSTTEAWEEASDEHEIPWIDVGDIAEPGEGPVANSYGVQSIPKSFLVDKHGCINHRDLSPEELEIVLRARYGT